MLNMVRAKLMDKSVISSFNVPDASISAATSGPNHQAIVNSCAYISEGVKDFSREGNATISQLDHAMQS